MFLQNFYILPLCVQLSCAKKLGKPVRELGVIHVSLAATYSDLRQHNKALEHYRHELKLREGNPKEVHLVHRQKATRMIEFGSGVSHCLCLMCLWQECETWLNIASCQEEYGAPLEELDNSYSAALNCAERTAQSKLQVPHASPFSFFLHDADE